MKRPAVWRKRFDEAHPGSFLATPPGLLRRRLESGGDKVKFTGSYSLPMQALARQAGRGGEERAGVCLLLLLFLTSLVPCVASPLICIDPGHPSEVGRGTQGKHLTEIKAAWQVALKLQAILQKRGMATVLTKKSEQQFVRNKDRASIANRAGAALMVRLHCDSDAGSGFAVYAPDRQGVSGGVRGPSAAIIVESRTAARAFDEALGRSLSGALSDRGLHPDTDTKVGKTQGALTGSVYSQVPVVLVEMCVLTNPRDEAFIASDIGQERMAQGLADGVSAALAALSSSDRGRGV